MRAVALYLTLAACIIGLLVLFSASAYPQIKDKALHPFTSPEPEIPVQSPASAPPIPSDDKTESDAPSSKAWVFDHKRDGRNYGLSEEQCLSAFPLLYTDIDRAVAYRRKIGQDISLQDVEVGWRGDGIVRAMVRDNQLYIIDAHGVTDRIHRSRSIATLNSLNRAVTAYNGKLPDVEFTFTDHDSALIDPDGNRTTLAYSRLAKQETLWLMPDFGFWGWPSVGMNSYNELRSILDQYEDDFIDKVPKLVWRGALGVAGKDMRDALIKHSEGQGWSDVQTITWKNETDVKEKLISMEDHCNYMFVAQTEGNTNSGRLKFLLNCHSIVMSHELHWIEHFHHLLQDSGPDQNYIKLRRDFSDLSKTMDTFRHPPTLQSKGQRIADNARHTFRERYLTPAAEACYWRALIRGWASVQGFAPQRWIETEVDDWHVGSNGKSVVKRARGVPFEAYAVMEATEWSIPAKGRHLCIDEEFT